MKCKCCNTDSLYLWIGNIININVKYYECPNCGYVQTEEPFWLESAYSSVINDSDTGILSRNYGNARIVLATLWLLGGLDEKMVDFAGGYGTLVRLMRDLGIDSYWADPYCENLFARSFVFKDNDQVKLITAFEAFEHVTDPIASIDDMLKISPNILLSTLIIPKPTPPHDEWWYYGKNHGQHIGFFRKKTFEYIAKARNKYLATDDHSYFLLSEKPVNPLAFKMAVKFSRLFPYLLRYKIRSKTWNDQQLIFAKNQEKAS